MTDFWTSTNERALEPKRTFRFKVTFGGGPVWWAKDVDQPQATVGTTEHDFMIHKFYYPGKVTWNQVAMTLVDPVTPGALDQLLTILRNTGYKIPGDPAKPEAFSSISKASATTNLGTVQIDVLDAEGRQLHMWELNNPFVMEITPSKLDYASEDLMTIALTLKYDWATYTSYIGPEGSRNEAGTSLFTIQDNNQS